jgi:amino acid permease
LLNVREKLPGRPSSLFEIGYQLFGRKSIFFIGFVLFTACAGLVTIYFIIFATTMQGIM